MKCAVLHSRRFTVPSTAQRHTRQQSATAVQACLSRHGTLHSLSGAQRTVDRQVTKRTALSSSARSSVHATAVAEEPATDAESVAESLSPAEIARTLVDLVDYGTLSTLTEDGTPLGTLVHYLLDGDANPVLRLRADAVHTKNLERLPKCSLFVHPAEQPMRLLGRVTLIGAVEPLTIQEEHDFRAKFATVLAEAVGVDTPQGSDIYMRLVVDSAFVVPGIAALPRAEHVDTEAYVNAEPDPLRKCAGDICTYLNIERREDVARLAAEALEVSFMDVEDADLLWMDQLGIHLVAQLGEGQGSLTQLIHKPFPRRVLDERDAKSELTMMAQLAWEREKRYVPPEVGESGESA